MMMTTKEVAPTGKIKETFAVELSLLLSEEMLSVFPFKGSLLQNVTSSCTL